MAALETNQWRERMPVDLDETPADVSRRETTTLGDRRQFIAPAL
jgi:hypothetical protein